MRALRYAFEEAFTSLWRGRQAGLLSTLTIALALFVFGGFLLVTVNLERLSREWSNAAELSVYLTDDVSAGDRRSVELLLTPNEVIAAHEYISKAEALTRFKQTFGDLGAAVDGIGGNPLPASIEVRLRAGAGVSTSLDTLAAQLRQMSGVADVRYDRQWLTRVLSAISVIRGVGWILGSVLVIAAALTVANVVRLALYARREELDITNGPRTNASGAPTRFMMSSSSRRAYNARRTTLATVSAAAITSTDPRIRPTPRITLIADSTRVSHCRS